MKRRSRTSSPAVEIQMGPMIDMVFLLLVFFMVTARPTKPESDVSIGLPGTASPSESINFPDEARIAVDDQGRVSLNELEMDSASDRELPELISTLFRLKQSADANRTEALVTIDADDRASHQRIVDVLNACARASITGVTFAGTEQDG